VLPSKNCGTQVGLTRRLGWRGTGFFIPIYGTPRRGALVDAQSKSVFTPLMLAMEQGDQAMAALLRQFKANPCLRDAEGRVVPERLAQLLKGKRSQVSKAVGQRS
jgi:hypothetical protein